MKSESWVSKNHKELLDIFRVEDALDKKQREMGANGCLLLGHAMGLEQRVESLEDKLNASQELHPQRP